MLNTGFILLKTYSVQEYWCTLPYPNTNPQANQVQTGVLLGPSLNEVAIYVYIYEQKIIFLLKFYEQLLFGTE